MTVKKVYAEIVNYLEQNQNELVKNVLDSVVRLASAKVTRSTTATHLKNEAGEVVAILCLYYKKWYSLVGEKAVTFGKKASTSTGYNPMCLEGQANWSRQNNQRNAAMQTLLNQVLDEKISPAQASEQRALIELEREEIIPTKQEGFDTIEEVTAYLESIGETVA